MEIKHKNPDCLITTLTTHSAENRLPTIAAKLIKQPRRGEMLIQIFLFFCGGLSILTTMGIVFELGKESLLLFSKPEVNLLDFLTITTWQPSLGQFSVLPLVNATLMTTIFAMIIALPLG